MTMGDLVKKRCLLKLGGSNVFNRQTVEEFLVLEISPSGNWVRLMAAVSGRKFWIPVVEVAFVEELITIQRERPPENRT